MILGGSPQLFYYDHKYNTTRTQVTCVLPIQLAAYIGFPEKKSRRFKIPSLLEA